MRMLDPQDRPMLGDGSPRNPFITERLRVGLGKWSWLQADERLRDVVPEAHGRYGTTGRRRAQRARTIQAP